MADHQENLKKDNANPSGNAMSSNPSDGDFINFSGFPVCKSEEKKTNWKRLASNVGFYSAIQSFALTAFDIVTETNPGTWMQEYLINAPAAVLLGTAIGVGMEMELRKPSHEYSPKKEWRNVLLGLVGAGILSVPTEDYVRASYLDKRAEQMKNDMSDVEIMNERVLFIEKMHTMGDEIAAAKPNTITWHQALKKTPLPQ